MKKALMFLVLIRCAIDTDLRAAQEAESTGMEVISIERGTHLTFRRYYFIARLEKTITLLREIMSTASTESITRIVNCSEMPFFSHQLIATARYRMHQSRSLKPIFVVWDDFSSYKALEAELVIGKDDLFVKEFTQQLFFITKNILAATNPLAYKNMFYTYDEIMQGSPEYIIDSIDYVVELIETNNQKTPARQTNTDIKMHATTDEINTRFYHIQRLITTIDLIEQCEASTESDRQRAPREMREMRREWTQIKQYRRLNDNNYIHGFCILLFSILKKHVSPEHHPQAFALIESVDIEEVLHGIDLIADELGNFVSNYEKNKKLSFREWLSLNWSQPIKSIFSILYGIFQYHYLEKNNHLDNPD